MQAKKKFMDNNWSKIIITVITSVVTVIVTFLTYGYTSDKFMPIANKGEIVRIEQRLNDYIKAHEKEEIASNEIIILKLGIIEKDVASLNRKFDQLSNIINKKDIGFFKSQLDSSLAELEKDFK